MKSNTFITLTAATILLTACTPRTESNNTATDTTSTVEQSPAAPETKNVLEASELQTLNGTYTGTDQGDYFHALVKGDDGTDWNFFFAPDLDEARSGEMIEGLWDGKKVKVGWRKTEREIPEAGGLIELDEIVTIEAL